MKLIVALVGGLLIANPIVAFVALARTGTLRRLLDENSLEFRDKLTDLIGETGRLKRELAELSRRLDQRGGAASPVAAAEERNERPAPDPVTAFIQEAAPTPVAHMEPASPKPVVPPPIQPQAATDAAAPQLSMKQPSPTQAIPPSKAVADVGIPKPVANVTAPPPASIGASLLG